MAKRVAARPADQSRASGKPIWIEHSIDNGIAQARWLSEDERALLTRRIAEEDASVEVHPSMLAVFADRRVWLMGVIYFACAVAQYGLTFWLPVLLQAAGVEGVLRIGALTANLIGSYNDVPFGSMHTGGANFGLGDGSVRFVRQGVSATTWAAANDPRDGRVAGSDW